MDAQQQPENPYRMNRPTTPAPGELFASASTPAPMPASPVIPRSTARTTKPGKGGTVALWLCAAFGAFMTVVSVGDVRYSVVYALGGVLLGLAVMLGFGWPLYCRRVDRKAVTAWENDQSETRELSALLTQEDAAIAQAIAPLPRPEPTPRNWKKVGTVVAVLAVLGGCLISTGDTEYKENNPDAVTSTQA